MMYPPQPPGQPMYPPPGQAIEMQENPAEEKPAEEEQPEPAVEA